VSDLVTLRRAESHATVTLDDGKVNALSPAMLAAIGEALDAVEGDGTPVVVWGRPGVWSAGFDLKVLRGGGPDAMPMLQAGFELAARVLDFPAPVVMVATGHAIAMGLFLLLSGDYRIGVEGDYRLTANEVALGLTMPRPAIVILRHRLTPAAFDRAVVLADVFTPAGAVAAGCLDRVVAAADLDATVSTLVGQLSGLDLAAHVASKRRAREDTMSALRAAIDAELG